MLLLLLAWMEVHSCVYSRRLLGTCIDLHSDPRRGPIVVVMWHHLVLVVVEVVGRQWLQVVVVAVRGRHERRGVVVAMEEARGCRPDCLR